MSQDENVNEAKAFTTAQPARLAHVPELDGIRGAAALAVFCHHLLFTSIPHPEQWNWFVRAASWLAQFGAWGVDLFFVLSGYLITSNLLLERTGPHFFRNFYWKRALRILPLYAVSLVCLAAFFPGSRRYALLAALFVANFATVFHVNSAGPYWTLAIEEQFYLIWPRFAWRMRLNRLQQVAAGMAVAGLVLRFTAAMFGHHDNLYTFFHSDGLALGAMLACQEFRRDERTNDPRLDMLRAKIDRRVALWVLAIAGSVLAALPFLLSAAGVAAEGKLAFAAEAFQLSGVSLLGYCIVAASVRRSGARMLGVLRGRLPTFFGMISYCFYMAHIYVLRLYDSRVGLPMAGEMSRYAARFFAVLGVTVVLCIVSRYTIELPALSLRRHVLRGTTSAKKTEESL